LICLVLYHDAPATQMEGRLMLEVEMKFPVDDFAPLERQLAAWRATAERREDTDCYYNAPDRNFGQTDEALRLRRIGERSWVTYKGPKRDAQTKTRTEIEVGLAPGDVAAEDFRRLLTCLGYRFTAEVRKRRAIYHLERAGYALEVCLDDIEGVGRYVELEIQAEEADLEKARQALLRAAEDLGLRDSERRSYLELLLQSRGEGR
jgi:adenylate cyclase class 2